MKNLKGKVVIIVGPYGGIGSAVSRKFHEAGATVVLAGRDRVKLDTLKKELGYERTSVVLTDATKMSDVKNLLDKSVKAYGHIDGVVIAIGSFHRLSLDDSLEEVEKQWQKDNEPLMEAPFFVGFAFAKTMLAQGSGVIFNFSSHAAKKPELPGNLLYAPAKSFGTSYMLGIAAELKRRGSKVRICDIQPMIVNTPENAKSLDTEEKRSQAIQPEEMADWLVEHLDDQDLPTEKEFHSSVVLD